MSPSPQPGPALANGPHHSAVVDFLSAQPEIPLCKSVALASQYSRELVCNPSQSAGPRYLAGLEVFQRNYGRCTYSCCCSCGKPFI
jgi:hypothetical protein